MANQCSRCEKEVPSSKHKFCEDCMLERRREYARKHRQKNGSKVSRGIHCSRCDGIKEHQERGYCLACERERYKERCKPDCATCGSIKENPRDAYCRACKNEKTRLKSLAEGRRSKNAKGRKETCSSCGQIKEENRKSESRCRRCKLAANRLRCKNTEQLHKDYARMIVRHNVKIGRLKKLPCEVCQTTVDVQGHHDDYTKPLDVRWLCRKHHQEHHKSVKMDLII